MSFHLEPGLIQITDTGGAIRFDSNEGMFHTLSSIDGSQAIPNYPIGDNQNTDATTSWLIGSCNANCTHLIGAAKFTLNSYSAGVAFNRWHAIMGGSVLWLQDGNPGNSLSYVPNGAPAAQLSFYSFRIDGTDVYLDRRTIAKRTATGVVYIILSHTIEFHLEAGLFT